MLDSLCLHNKKERPKVTEPVISLYCGSHHLYYVIELVGLHSYTLFSTKSVVHRGLPCPLANSVVNIRPFTLMAASNYSRVKDLPKKLGLDFPRYECSMLPGCDINMLHPWKYDNNVKLLSQQPKVCVRKLRRRMVGLKPLLSGFCCL